MKQFHDYVHQHGGFAPVAKRLGVSVVTVQKWSYGTRRPTPELALAIEIETGGAIPKEEWYWPTKDDSYLTAQNRNGV